MLLPWAAGFAAYELVAPTAIGDWAGWASWWVHRRHDLGLSSPPAWLSASVTSLLVAAVLTVAVGQLDRAHRRRIGGARVPAG
jgi:hypothetical protein